jgi:hypothetical protein
MPVEMAQQPEAVMTHLGYGPALIAYEVSAFPQRRFAALQ